jgi:SAM-dependent methyltransferase
VQSKGYTPIDNQESIKLEMGNILKNKILDSHVDTNPNNFMSLLFSFIKDLGWDGGLREFLNQTRLNEKKEFAFLFDNKLASAWKFFISVPPNGKILVLESPGMLGRNVVRAAELKKLAIEVSPGSEHAYCVKKRASSMGLKVETCVVSNIDLLPFSNECFDLIAVCGFEEISEMFGYWSLTRKAVEKFVLSLNRLLKPDGSMFISAINSSTKMLWQTRKINFAHRLIQNSIKKNGMKIEKIFHLFPSHGQYVTIDSKVSGQSPSECLKRKINALLRSENVGYICSRKGSIKKDTSIFNSVVDKISDKINAKDIRFERLISGSGAAYIIDLKECMVRLPSNTVSGSVERWRNNYESLTKLRNSELPFSVPKPILFGDINNQPFSVETKLYKNCKICRNIRIWKKSNVADQAVSILISL